VALFLLDQPISVFVKLGAVLPFLLLLFAVELVEVLALFGGEGGDLLLAPAGELVCRLLKGGGDGMLRVLHGQRLAQILAQNQRSGLTVPAAIWAFPSFPVSRSRAFRFCAERARILSFRLLEKPLSCSPLVVSGSVVSAA
jgi:hypothetical protein